MTAPNSISADELDATRALDQPESTSVAEGLWVEGTCYAYGLEGHLQDYRKAFDLYTQAARLGSAKAYDSLASMTEEGNGTPANSERALELRRKSGELGNYFAYGSLMLDYANREHEHNFQTCMTKMLEQRRIQLQSKSELPSEEYEVISFIRYYLVIACRKGWRPKLFPEAAAYAQDIRALITASTSAETEKVLDWMSLQGL